MEGDPCDIIFRMYCMKVTGFFFTFRTKMRRPLTKKAILTCLDPQNSSLNLHSYSYLYHCKDLANIMNTAQRPLQEMVLMSLKTGRS